MTLKDRLRGRLISRKTPYPYGTRKQYIVGGLVAIIIPATFMMLGYVNGAYVGPGEWVYMFVTPWHLLTIIGLYYVGMAFLIREKGKGKR